MADDKEKQDQESLKAIQEQNETAKELLSTYEKLKKVKRSLTDDEKATLDISKQLIQYSKTLETSIQQRNDKSATSKQLSKTLNQLQKEYNENLDNSKNTIDKLNKAREIALKSARDLVHLEIKAINNKNTLEEQAIELEAKKEAARLAGNADLVKDLHKQIKAKENEIQIVQKGLDKLVKQREEQENLAKQLKEAKKVHDETLKQQGQEVELLKEEVGLRKLNNTLDAVGDALGLKKLKNALSLSSIFGLK